MPNALLHQFCKISTYCTHKTTVISLPATSHWVSARDRFTNQYAFFKFQADFHLHKLVHPTTRSPFLLPVPICCCS